MAILIEDRDTESLIRELAARTGETITEAVRQAAELRLPSLPPVRRRLDRAKLAEAQAYLSAPPKTNEHLTDERIIGYTDEGHFE